MDLYIAKIAKANDVIFEHVYELYVEKGVFMRELRQGNSVLYVNMPTAAFYKAMKIMDEGRSRTMALMPRSLSRSTRKRVME